MDSTPNLLLPFIMPQQAQKFVTHNAALDALDALVMLAVASRTLAAPPSAPAEGDRYIPAAGATGAWAGKDGMLAAWQNGAWSFYAPQPGWLAWCAQESQLLVFNGGWSSAMTMQNLSELGVNASADSTNRLAVSSPAALFTHAGSDHRLVINKQAAGDTASILMQDNYSGRAEIGLTGDDRLAMKVSADGTNFTSAIVVDNASGAVSFPASRVLSNYAVSLLQDSGRMAGNGAAALTIGGYAFPAYFLMVNGSTQAALAKFIYNNTDNGGTAGSLNPYVADLINQIRSSAYRRYGPEFWVAEVTMGSGTSNSPQSAGGVTGHLGLYTFSNILPPALTFHVYVRALTNEIVIAISAAAGQTGYKNGVAQTGNFLVAPSDGWVSITIQQQADPYNYNGYNPYPLEVFCQAAGDQYLLACPALMGGITTVDDNIGIIAGANSWSA